MELEGSLSEQFRRKLSLDTAAISLVSHTHGRERRAERHITRLELQAAIKHGRKERAHRGRDGAERWRFTYAGVVYVTDETCRQEITSWRLDEAALLPPAPAWTGAVSSHTILIVDQSGSMRKADVPGHGSRTEAVYRSILRDLVLPQQALSKADPAIGSAVVSLIEMSDTAHVLFERLAIDERLVGFLEERATSRARSHGNYLPALDEAFALLQQDSTQTGRILLVLLSDGAPSDHCERECAHGVAVWQPARSHFGRGGGRGSGRGGGRPVLQNCTNGKFCRSLLKSAVEAECRERIVRLGDIFGRDRVSVHSVAFGDPAEDYSVLESMAEILPGSSFQKLGLAASGLRTAFASLNTSLTTLRTVGGDAGGVGRLTPRALAREEASTSTEGWERPQIIYPSAGGWNTYTRPHALVSKRRYDHNKHRFVDVPLEPGADGVAVFARWFAQGVERCVFRCSEINAGRHKDGAATLVGERLVAKETLHVEHLLSAKFHEQMAKTQAEAEYLAERFNARTRADASEHIHFVPTVIYEVLDPEYCDGCAWILAEPELEGKFTKWNNNGGAVLQDAGGDHDASAGAGMGAICEDDDEPPGGAAGSAGGSRAHDIPQCFSHFTWSVTDGDLLICDLQGVWNATDGFLLTDPAMHRAPKAGRSRRGATDKGREGIANFFKTHTCGALCVELGLKKYAAAGGRQ